MYKFEKTLFVAAVAAAFMTTNAYAAEAVNKNTGYYAELNYNIVDSATAVVDYGNVDWSPNLLFSEHGATYGVRGGYVSQKWRAYVELNPTKRVDDKSIQSGYLNHDININEDGSSTQINGVKLAEDSFGVGGDYIWNINSNNRVFVGGALRFVHQKGEIYSCGFPLAGAVTSNWTAHNERFVTPTLEAGYQFSLDNGLYFGLESRWSPTTASIANGVTDYPGDARAPGAVRNVKFQDSYQVGINIGYVF
jgi:opacity protein-like surface antigen